MMKLKDVSKKARRFLAWMLCAVMVFGSLCVSDDMAMSVHAAESAEMSAEMSTDETDFTAADMTAEDTDTAEGYSAAKDTAAESHAVAESPAAEEEHETTETAKTTETAEAVKTTEAADAAMESSSETETPKETETADVTVKETLTETMTQETESMPETGETETEAAEETLKLAFSGTDIANGTYTDNGSNIAWRIDAEGNLTVEGTGNYTVPIGNSRGQWYRYRENIKTAVVRIKGLTFARSMFEDHINLESVDLSGLDTSRVTDMEYMFLNCENLKSLDLSGFDTSRVTNMRAMFYNCRNLKSLNVSKFDTGSVTNMQKMFGWCESLTSLDLSGWDTGSVADMNSMFEICSSLTSLDLSGWDTGSVADMNSMFEICSSLTSLDLSGWNNGSVTDMSFMFERCSSLTSLDLSGWGTSSVKNMLRMFYDCSSLTSLDLSSFDTSSVTNMLEMFQNCRSLKSLDLSKFDTSSVTDMSNMFDSCSGLTSLDLSKLDTSSVTNMASMFMHCRSLKSLNLSSFDTSSVTNMSGMFGACVSLESLDVSGFDTSSVTDMSFMFCHPDISVLLIEGCSSLKSLDVSGWDTSSVTNMGLMFGDCESLKSLDLSGWNTSSVTNMSFMFERCSSLTSLDVSGWNTGSVTNMSYMFDLCGRLANLNLSGWDTSSVANMDRMFRACGSLTSLDLGGWDTGSVTDMASMFYQCSGLKSLNLSGWDTSSVTDMGGMFADCQSLTSLDLSSFDTHKVTNMKYMFETCPKLASLNLSGWDTGSVIYMSGMFRHCHALTSLDVSGFDTSSVTDMNGMFTSCINLKSLDLSGFNMGSVTDMSDLLLGCNSLTALHTPYNIPKDAGDRSLPIVYEADVWRDAAGKTYKELPEGLARSILLAKNTTPKAMQAKLTVRLAKSSYAKGSSIDAKDLTVVYRGTDGSSKTLSPQGASGTPKGYTLSAVDMNTLGEKTMTVSYNDGKNTLTAAVAFMVHIPLTDSMVTLPAGEYVYNGRAHKPVPVVTADGKTLAIGTDYALSYTNNMDAGEAALVVRGKNSYSGTITKTFTIRKAKIENVKLTFSEAGGEPHYKSTRNISAYISKMIKDSGSIYFTVGEIVEDNKIPNGEGSVLQEKPYVMTSYNVGVLTYSTNAGTVGDTVQIPVTASFEKNYEDVLFDITIRLTDKIPAAISGIAMKNSVYNGKPASFEGTAAVRTEGSPGKDITKLVTLSYHYAGKQANGTAYDSGTAPTHAGSYVMTVTVAGSNLYAGSAEYPFAIGKAPLSIKAKDMELVIREFDAIPNESELKYDVLGLCGTHTARDVFDTLPTVSYGINGKKIDKEGVIIDKTGIYELIPDGAVLKQAQSFDYEIKSYINGTFKIKDTGDSIDLKVTLIDDKPFVYTGSVIKPAIEVANNGKILTEGMDYTVKYSNNINAGTAKLTVTGTGSFTGKQDITFTIEPKSLKDADIVAKDITIAANSKASPVVLYNGVKLGARDYTLSDTGKIAVDKELDIEGQGNYKDSIKINVKAVAKENLGKFKVNMKKDKFVYDGNEHRLGFEVIDSKTKEPLKENEEYMAVYSNDVISAGTVKVTIIGMGAYSGLVTSSYKIAPANEEMALTFNNKTYTFDSAGTTVDGIVVKVKNSGKELDQGKDYKISYSANKKAGTGVISAVFIGNYKGSRTLKGTFNIEPAVLSDETVSVVAADKAYTGRKDAYKSAPIVTDKKGNVLRSSDYTVNYYNSSDMTDASEINGKNNLVELGGNEDSKTIYVKVTGKGSYAGASGVYARGEYNVRKTTSSVLDISKAKVTFKNKRNAIRQLEYTGNALEPDMEVSVNVKGVGTVILDPGQYGIRWLNNVNKGKATAVITGNGTEVNGYAFVGSKNASISIVSRNLKNVQNLWQRYYNKLF